MKAAIIGAGHAGVTASEILADNNIEVTLFSEENVLPYYRPRVVALAFGLVEDEEMSLHPREWYEQRNINLRLDTRVRKVHPDTLTVETDKNTENFDAVIIAAGALPIKLPFTRDVDGAIPMWDYNDSKHMHQHIKSANQLAILGGGITGVETAIYASELGIETTLIEQKEILMPLQFGPTGGDILKKMLEARNVNVLTGTTAKNTEQHGKQVEITMADNNTCCTDLLITSIGGKPDLEPYTGSAIKLDRGIQVDDYLCASHKGIFACGDIAQQDHCSAANLRLATQQGRTAAGNVIKYLEGKPLTQHPHQPVSLSFKHSDIQIHTGGDAPQNTDEEKILTNTEDAYRAVCVRDNILRGVNMLGTREKFRELTKLIGEPWGNIHEQVNF